MQIRHWVASVDLTNVHSIFHTLGIPGAMDPPDLVYLPQDTEIERNMGEVPRLRLAIDVRDTNHSKGLDRFLQVNRISLNIELHGVNNNGSSNLVGSLGTFDSTEPANMMLGLSYKIFFSIPLNSTVIEKMLQVRDNNEQVAFKMCGTIAAVYYQKLQNGCSILDVFQVQHIVNEYTSHGKMPLLLIPARKFDEILKRINYAEILKFEIPLYGDESSTNEALKATIRLLKDAKKQLREGKNDTAMIDVRKALTNHLLTITDQGEKKLDSSLKDDWVKRSPAQAQEIYKELFLRMEEGLRAVLKITNKFLHDDNTLLMAPLRKDSEYVYFSVAYIINRFASDD